jgi:hypothetical protein
VRLALDRLPLDISRKVYEHWDKGKNTALYVEAKRARRMVCDIECRR